MTDERRSSIWFSLTAALVLALVVYPLSAGPAVWLAVHVLPRGANDTIESFYGPIGWIVERSQTAQDAWAWYILCWVDLEDLVDLVAVGNPP